MSLCFDAENKSLNIFNSRLVLATPETATDADFNSIEVRAAHNFGNAALCTAKMHPFLFAGRRRP